MVGGHELVAAPFQPLPAELRNPARSFQKRFRGDGAQAHDHLWPDHINLPQQIRRTRGHFIRLWRAIFRRPAFHDIADVNVFALQAHRFDHLRQQFAGAADKRDVPADLRRRPAPRR